MPDPDPEIDRWIHQHRNDADAQLRATVASKVKHCVDYKAALELLDRREKQLRLEDLAIAEKRHNELNARLEALEKPHWTTTPGFYATIAGVLLAGLAAWFAWLSIPRPVPQDAVTPQSDRSTQTPVTK